MTVRIEPTSESTDGRLWTPRTGEFTAAFLRGFSKDPESWGEPNADQTRVLEEAKRILGSCRPPTADATENQTTLVVGYVQSGKTRSFTTVAALARDNQFGIVIVLAGTTKNLREQSESRLAGDLDMGRFDAAWRLLSNPGAAEAAEVSRLLGNWKKWALFKTRTRPTPSLMITVLKNSARIDALTRLLSTLELADVPVLIIDDESDQASLNTRARVNLVSGGSDASATFESIAELRDVLPHHSFIQYTATPQANLLLAIGDVLDPGHAEVISEGSGYTGGDYFFVEHRGEVVRTIPQTDLIDYADPPAVPPVSLQKALRQYLLGAAHAAIQQSADNRSMLVQASQNTAPHALFERWIKDLMSAWRGMLESNDKAFQAVARADFRSAYDDLLTTEPTIEPFEELIEAVPEVCDEVRVVQVNAVGQEVAIDWSTDQFWILIGGQKLDRGFTVRGLTITYMPRTASESADVLQQRARFFGYRADYFGLCRVYVTVPTEQAFVGYVKDETFLRDQLATFQGDLREWRRSFLSNRAFRQLSRPNAQGRSLRRVRVDAGWLWPRELATNREEMTEAFEDFIESLPSDGLVDIGTLPDIRDGRESGARHLVCLDVPQARVARFLAGLPLRSEGDRSLVTALLESSAFDEALPGVDVVQLYGADTSGQRGRALGDFVANPFIGQSPAGVSADQARYGGDRQMHRADTPTLHIRRVLLQTPNSAGFEPCYWFAMFIPVASEDDLMIEQF